MQKESDYIVKNQKLIVEHLKDLYKGKCIIAAHFGENNASFLTAILELDTKNGIIKFDTAPSELLNKQLLNAAKVLFRTEINGIKVSFSGKHIKKSSHGGSALFEMPLPTAIFWMQRRQFYRIKVPLAHTGSYCKIFFRSEPTTEVNPETILTGQFRIADLSITGFAFLSPYSEFTDYFEENKYFSECTLYLHEGPHSEICFTIKEINVIKLNNNIGQQRIGCLFNEASQTLQTGLQRYMQNIERLQKNIG